ncbi:hypothetical protein CHS0354_031104 [Potamilus streckersoni]|uniref:Uncharacterized protein n=1 Tax=Potamilus streckersoni TaxID=2493646 RepID=A0AAE0RY75_9BIVA|nr:hypothetical protein CHS0354_031104 [Potamilus streckersoni]
MLKIENKVTKSPEAPLCDQYLGSSRSPWQQPSIKAYPQVIETPLKEALTEYIKKTKGQFWDNVIRKHFYPFDQDIKQQENIKQNFISRNNVLFGFFLLNFIFSVALLQLQLDKYQLRFFYIVGKYEPVSVSSY